MGLMAADSGGGDFRQVPEGVLLARCFRIVDLGQQEVVWQGTAKYQHKCLISWEVYGEDEDGQPLTLDDGSQMSVSKRYTVSLSNKARLRGDLEAWRGKKFTDDEAKGFLISKLIGAPALLNIVHNEANGKTYANIASLSPVPKQMAATLPAPVNAPVTFDLDNPDMAVFETFHDRLKETIQKSLEWQSRNVPKQSGERVAQQAYAPSGGVDDLDDDIPF